MESLLDFWHHRLQHTDRYAYTKNMKEENRQYPLVAKGKY